MHLDKERFRIRRAQLGLSQAQIAEKLGVGQKTISRIENGEYQPGEQILRGLAQALDVSLDWLCGLTDNVLTISTAPQPIPTTKPALPLAQAIDRALFDVVKSDDVDPEDYHAARQALISSSIRIDRNDLPRIAKAWLTAAKQLRLEGQLVNSLNITMQVAVNATASASQRSDEIGSTSGVRPAFDDDGRPVPVEQRKVK